MCNEYQRYVPLGLISDQFTQLKIPLRFPEGLPNLAPANIRIGDVGSIIRPSTAELRTAGPSTAEPGTSEPRAAELVQRRWSWPGPTGKPVFNYRSDGREFSQGRCLIVTDGFFEFTDDPDGAKRAKKKKWLFTKNDEPWFAIAGLWRTDPSVGEAYTMLTTAPGPDVAPYHNRQVAVLHRAQWPVWLDQTQPVNGLIAPLPAGTLSVAAV